MKILNVSCAQQDKIEQRLFDEVEAGGYDEEYHDILWDDEERCYYVED
mgnify:CR=1 FL=1